MKQYSKAIAATVFGFLGGVGAQLADGNLTQEEVLVSLGAGIVAGVATALAPANQPS
jgi:hypothetical protein